MNYNYDIFRKNINGLKMLYPFLEVGIIGYSILGKEIPYIKIGRGARQVLYHGSIHANEWITSVLLMKFIENFCKAYISNSNIYGYSTQNLFNKVSLYIVPMVNPDGVDLVTGNIDKNSNIYKNYVYLSKFYPSIEFPNGWKANFNGVDLKIYQLKKIFKNFHKKTPNFLTNILYFKCLYIIRCFFKLIILYIKYALSFLPLYHIIYFSNFATTGVNLFAIALYPLIVK